MTDVELRGVAPDDRAAFLDLLAAYLEELDAYELDWDPAPPAEAYGRAFEDDPDGQRIDWILADGDRAGFFVSRVIPYWPQEDLDVAEIVEFYVLPAFRRRGIGRAAVEAWLAEQRRDGVYLVEASILARNELARAFWEQLGFVPRSTLTIRKP